MVAVWFTKRWLYSLQTRVPAIVLAVAGFFWCAWNDVKFVEIEESFEMMRLNPIAIAASIAYAGSALKSKNIFVAMILFFITSISHFGVVSKPPDISRHIIVENSYRLGVLASVFYVGSCSLITKSDNNQKEDKRTLISSMIIVAAFVVTLFVPVSEISCSDRRDGTETFLIVIFAWFLERAVCFIGTLPRHAMLIHFYNIITRVLLLRAADTIHVARAISFNSSNGLAAYIVFVTYMFFAMVFAYTCLRRVYDAVQHFSPQDVSVTFFLCSALFDTSFFLLLSSSSSSSETPRAVLCVALNILVINISIRTQKPKINPKSKDIFYRSWVDTEHKCEWSKESHFLVDFVECKHEIHELLSSAKKSVYYSTFLCDFEFPLLDNSNETMANILNRLARRGVNVYVLYNPCVKYGNKTVQYVREILDDRIRITTAKTNLELSTLSRSCQTVEVCGYHHQKYICVDDKTAMVCGCDVNGERAGWLVKNCMGYYWDEIATVVPCSREMAKWFRLNFESPHQYESPFPLLSGGLREHDAMVHLIRSAKHEVYFANQTLLTGSDMYTNMIGHAIVDRVVRARHTKTPFQIMLLTNGTQNDEPGFWTKVYCRYSPMMSLLGIEDYALSCGITLQELYEHFYVGTLEHDGVLVKVHSNIIAADQNLAIRSSGNLSDRCFSDKPTDSELGVMLQGSEVKMFLQYHYRRLLPDFDGPVDQELTLFDLRHASERNLYGSLLRPSLSPLLDEPFLSRELGRTLMYFLTAMSEGATGGKELPLWENERF